MLILSPAETTLCL